MPNIKKILKDRMKFFSADSGYNSGEKIDNFFYECLKLLRNVLFTIFLDFTNIFKFFNKENSKILNDQGVLFLKNFISNEKCDKAFQDINTLLEKYPVSIKNKLIKSKNGSLILYRSGKYDNGMIDITNPELEVNEIKLIATKLQRLINIVNSCSLRRLKLNRINAYINNSITNTRNFHIDTTHSEHFKIILYLTNCKLEDGPYSYILGSHKFNIYKYINLFINFITRKLQLDMTIHSKKNIEVYPGEKGSCIVSNQNGFHRGLPQNVGHGRVALIFNLYA